MYSPFSFRRSFLRLLNTSLSRRLTLLCFACSVLFTYYVFTETSKHRDLKLLREKTEEFLRDPLFLTIHCNAGRLGNQMFLYATLYGLAQLNHRTPYSPHCNMVHLSPHFEVTMNEIEELPQNTRQEHEISNHLRPEDGSISKAKNILGGNDFPTSYTFFNHVRKEITKQFKLKKHLVEYADRVLFSLNKNGPSTVYVGIHVRKTDYCAWLANYNGTEVNVEYFAKAMKYFRDRYHPVLFVAVSDDRVWCRENLANYPNVAIAPRPPDAAYDLAILTRCNHTIISYGSFGFWGAYLAGGEVVYFSDYLSPYSSFLRMGMSFNSTYLPEWKAISTIKQDFWKTYVADKPHCYKWFWEQIIDWFRE